MLNKYLANALLIGLISLWFTGCSDIVEPPKKSKPQVLPSITSSMTGEWHQGKFVWHDLLTDDVRAAREFYGDVFGWTFKVNGAYTQVFNQDKLIGGMMHVTSTDEQKDKAVWLPTMSVKDLDALVRYVEFRKGELLKGPLDMNERGKGVLVSDSHGAHIVLLDAKNGDPQDVKPQVGDWLWNELWTNKPKESYTFYRNIGKYDAYEMRGEYRVLKSKGKWRAGIREIDKDDYKARWVPTIRVSSLNETISKVKDAGGELLVSPNEELVNGNVALIADNRGAPVIIQHWEEGEE